MDKAKIVLLILPLSLCGCASLSPDAGFSDIIPLVKKHIDQSPVQQRSTEDIIKSQAQVESLLKQPLTTESVVQITLLNNPGLQGALKELDIAEAELVQAQTLPNPSFSYLHLSKGSDLEIERHLLFDVMQLLTLKLRTQIEKRHFEQAKLQAAMTVLTHATTAQKAFYQAVAAEQIVDSLKQETELTRTSAQLAKQMNRVGNISKHDEAKEKMLAMQSSAQLANAKRHAMIERERLAQILGLCDTAFTLPKRLPDLPSSLSLPECNAVTQRMDIQVGKLQLQSTAKALGLSQATRFIDVLEVGYANKTIHETDQPPRLNGYEITLQIPLFDWGVAKVAKAEAIYMQSVWRLRELTLHARSEIRSAHFSYQSAFEMTKQYRDEILPLHQRIVDEDLKLYNGMLISPFELFSAVHEKMQSTHAYIELLRDFWLADADLQAAVIGVNHDL